MNCQVSDLANLGTRVTGSRFRNLVENRPVDSRSEILLQDLAAFRLAGHANFEHDIEPAWPVS